MVKLSIMIKYIYYFFAYSWYILFISLILIRYFNPFVNVKLLTEVRRKIIFSAGIFLLISLGLEGYIEDIRKNINRINNKYRWG